MYFACLLAILCLAGCAKRTNQSTTDENVEVTKIYNLVILDRSGSMTPLREAAVQGYNETLDVIRNAQQKYGMEQQHLVTLTLFDRIITNVFDCDTVKNIPDLLLSEYQPNGSTAMLDAIGISLTNLKNKLDSLENATAVVIIISDGMENASYRYNVKTVNTLIDFLKNQGVMFVFIGTNQNVEMTAAALHIDEYKFFPYTTEGMKEAWQSGINASADYYQRMSEYNKDTRDMSKEKRNAYYRDKNKENTWFK